MLSLVKSSLGRASCFHDNWHEAKSWKAFQHNNYVLLTQSRPFLFLYFLYHSRRTKQLVNQVTGSHLCVTDRVILFFHVYILSFPAVVGLRSLGFRSASKPHQRLPTAVPRATLQTLSWCPPEFGCCVHTDSSEHHLRPKLLWASLGNTQNSTRSS